jgi:cytoplasmic tRNA 2-thiolation protein 2
MPSKVLQDVCVDCQSAEATLDIRKRRLCRDCFMKYVNSKVLKRMESYRFGSNNADTRRRLLLPVSGGVSSLVLLQVLHSQMQRQLAKRNKTAYQLLVVIIGDNLTTTNNENAHENTWYAALQIKFPTVSFIPMKSLPEVFTLDPTIEGALQAFGVNRLAAESDRDFVIRILSPASSLTAGSDLHEILLNRLIVSCAKQHDCESILWGHSDSRLAAKALAGVAKGRGGSLPFEICDGLSKSGVNFSYPLRDLFKPELSLYASLLPEVFSELITRGGPAPREKTSIRNTSIDDLLTDYIISQGEKYPSIMANVVRTASKLRSPSLDETASSCQICLVPLQRDPGQVSSEQDLCYGCARTRQDLRGGKTT